MSGLGWGEDPLGVPQSFIRLPTTDLSYNSHSFCICLWEPKQQSERMNLKSSWKAQPAGPKIREVRESSGVTGTKGIKDCSSGPEFTFQVVGYRSISPSATIS